MTWLLYTLLCALLLATSDVFAKKALKHVDEYIVAWGRLVWAAPFILCALPFIAIPSIQPSFWLALLILLPIEISAIILYVKALKASPLSITTPFLGLTPLFIIGTSFIILGELPDKSGFAGILLIACGAYFLNIRQARIGLFGPLRAVVNERGSMYMVIVAAIYSVTAILGKICAQSSSPVFFGVIYVIITPLVLFPIVYNVTEKNSIKQAYTNPNFILLGLFYGLMIVCHLQAIVLVEASYMIAVKRTSLLFSIVYGKLIFKETGFSERLIGGLLMIAGIVFITLL